MGHGERRDVMSTVPCGESHEVRSGDFVQWAEANSVKRASVICSCYSLHKGRVIAIAGGRATVEKRGERHVISVSRLRSVMSVTILW